MTGQKKDSSDPKAEPQSSTVTNEAPPIAEAIEEDDEFEEFENCNWDSKDEDTEDAQQWQDNWDDDDIDDEFTQQLRAELVQNSGN